MRLESNQALPPLPAELMAALEGAVAPAGGKRDRTRLQLLGAAMQVFSSRGVGQATLQEIAAVAGVANGTVYNHFRTKEEVLQAVAAWLAGTLCRAIDDSYQSVREGAERMAIANRRYLWLAEQSPQWTLLLTEVTVAAPEAFETVRGYALADLRLGIKQKAFKVVSEAAAMDLIFGTVSRGMLSVALGQAPAGHAAAIAATVLRGLGVPPDEAAAIVKRPLPPLAPAD